MERCFPNECTPASISLSQPASEFFQWLVVAHTSNGPPQAMRKAAVSVEKLADIAREELPGTMAAIRLSGMEISDLTLELNDLRSGIDLLGLP